MKHQLVSNILYTIFNEKVRIMFPNKELYLCRGLPGSGKSFVAKEIQQKLDGIIFSTDNFWIRPSGQYDWNYKLIKEAHDWNKRMFDLELGRAYIIIVDNTNLSWKEMEYYILKAYHKDYNIILLESSQAWKFDPLECSQKTVHKVPLETIEKMLQRWESSDDIMNRVIWENGILPERIRIQVGIN